MDMDMDTNVDVNMYMNMDKGMDLTPALEMNTKHGHKNMHRYKLGMDIKTRHKH
jgi:hypothetical protein